ncbi:MAG TPA: 2TM domain-containing protein [Polyangiales bacterium]
MAVSEQERARIIAEIRHKARHRARVKIGFMYHFLAFAMANGAMYAINQTYTPKTLWFVWPLCGWGVALVMHAFATFQGSGLTEDMVDAEVQRELARRGLT